jgi:hypothetical protein
VYGGITDNVMIMYNPTINRPSGAHQWDTWGIVIANQCCFSHAFRPFMLSYPPSCSGLSSIRLFSPNTNINKMVSGDQHRDIELPKANSIGLRSDRSCCIEHNVGLLKDNMSKQLSVTEYACYDGFVTTQEEIVPGMMTYARD